MKRKKRLYAFAVMLLLALTAFPCNVFAADGENGETPPPPAVVYPAEVRASEENGVARLEKVYYLSVRDDPAAIPTADFDREGLHYTLLDVLKTDMTETDTRDYVEVVTLESATKDMAEIIKALEPELEVVTEDGYTGVLKPDYANISVEAAGYKTNSWTVSATRTYPNLSDADISLLPKSIEDSGRTLTLADVQWQDASTDYVDGDPLAVRYTAVASYTGTATGRSVTGYTVTVDYMGEVTRTTSDTVIYTAIFSAQKASQIETHFDTAPNESEPTPERTQPETTAPWWAIPLGLLAVGGVGYGGWRGYTYLKKKRGEYIK